MADIGDGAGGQAEGWPVGLYSPSGCRLQGVDKLRWMGRLNDFFNC